METAYTAAFRVVAAIAPLLAFGDGKLARGLRGRRGAVSRFEAWAAASRDRARPLAWFHAPSVGEGLQARAVIEALRESNPEAQIVYTYFSPSAVPFAARTPVDFADYLPLDLPGPVARLFDALAPDVVAFTKTEVWPNVTREAARRGIPVLLLSATLPESSSRLRGRARMLLTPAHRRLAHVGAISAEDGLRFRSLGVPPERISVMGDARFDQVARRARQPFADPTLIQSIDEPDRITIVAGSTWPADEDRLIAAFASADVRRGGPRLVLVPHEPNEAHLTRLADRLGAAGLAFARLTDAEGLAARPPVIVIDRVGILGDLYRLADIAYVGGGFGSAGLHSVLEPAAFGAPVLFGPNHGNAREAAELVAAGAALAVSDQAALAGALARWIDYPDARVRAGDGARAFIDAGLGAARRGAEVVAAELLNAKSEKDAKDTS